MRCGAKVHRRARPLTRSREDAKKSTERSAPLRVCSREISRKNTWSSWNAPPDLWRRAV